MSEKQETIADFIEVRRARANEIESKAGGMPNRFQRELIADLRDEANRLESAWKREKATADAKIADLQSRVKLWTDRSNELVKKCDEYYANARKSERGNCKKLREALVKFVRAYEQTDDMSNIEDTAEAYELARAALAAPVRNCDAGTVEERAKRYHEFCRGRMCETCPALTDEKDDSQDGSCIIQWEDMPYEKGEAK